jgi:hypothetical protein
VACLPSGEEKKVSKDRSIDVTVEQITKLTGLTAADQRRLTNAGAWFEFDSRTSEMIMNYDDEDGELRDIIMEIRARLMAEQAAREVVPIAWQSRMTHSQGGYC